MGIQVCDSSRLNKQLNIQFNYIQKEVSNLVISVYSILYLCSVIKLKS